MSQYATLDVTTEVFLFSRANLFICAGPRWKLLEMGICNHYVLLLGSFHCSL